MGTADICVLQLPGGLEIQGAPGETADQIYWRHARLSMADGLCPHHQTPLTPVQVSASAARDIAAGGHCGACGKFWSLTRQQEAAWDIDHDPHTFQPMTPHWVA